MNLVMVEEEIQATMKSVVTPGFSNCFYSLEHWCLWALMRLSCKTERVVRVEFYFGQDRND